MYVEDLFLRIRDTQVDYLWKRRQVLFGGLLNDDWHQKFIRNIGNHIDANKSLSTKQSIEILKLIGKSRSYIIEYGWMSETVLDLMLSDPQFRNPLYESTNVPREVRYVGDNLLAFRFKKDDDLRDSLKSVCYPRINGWLNDMMPDIYQSNPVRDSLMRKPRYDWLYKVWIISVYRFNVREIVDFIHRQHFKWDDATARYLKLCCQSFDQPSRMVIEHEIIVANVRDDPLLSDWITENAAGIPL